MQKSGNTLLTLVMIIGMATWGLSWTNGKILGTYTAPPVLMVWRFIIAAVTMLMVLLFTRTSVLISRRGILPIIGGSLLLVIYNYSYFTGTHQGAAGAGGVLVTTLNPVLTFILVSILYWKVPNRRSLTGILMGILGGILLLGVWQQGWSIIFSQGNLYFILCAASWAVLTIVSTTITRSIHTLTFSFWLYLISAILAVPLTNKNQLQDVLHFDGIFWLNLMSISVGAMAFATTAYFIAAARLGSARAAAFIFTVPVSAMAFSMLILHESLSLTVAAGGLLSIMAVYLINSSKNNIETADSFSETP